VPPSRQHPSVRVLIGLTEISGYGRNLVVGLRKLGVSADLLDLNPSVYGYGGDDPPTKLMSLLQRIARARARTSRSDLAKKVGVIAAQWALTVPVFVQALLRYDAFVFLYDSAFIDHRELALMRVLRKQVIYVFCGSDVRPTYLDGALMSSTRGTSTEACIASVSAKRRMLGRIERHATAIVGHPSYAQLQTRSFISFLELGIPRDLGPPGEPDHSRRIPVVVHAPTQPEAKGTEVVRDAVRRLAARGVEFVYEEVQGVKNDVLLERLRGADLVIDMVWGDTPMAGLAADAAWFGCPTVVGGYGWTELREFTSADGMPPSECCLPEELERAVEGLILDAGRRRALGIEAQAFVTTRWAADVVASKFIRILDGNAPAEWFCDPYAIRYALGWGQPRERTRQLVRDVLERAGRKGLGVADKPELEECLVKISESEADV
jgi:hypothetical protein